MAGASERRQARLIGIEEVADLLVDGESSTCRMPDRLFDATERSQGSFTVVTWALQRLSEWSARP
jgi:hypothetical protein